MLNQEKLKEYLHYEYSTGIFTWRISLARRIKIGDVAGCNHSGGYKRIFINKKDYFAHRLAWLYFYGVWPENHIDHIDGDKLNNRISNLRDVTNSINMQNQVRARIDNTTGLLGVCVNGKSYRSQIKINGKCISLGTFSSPEEAHLAYLEAKRKLHPGNTI